MNNSSSCVPVLTGRAAYARVARCSLKESSLLSETVLLASWLNDSDDDEFPSFTFVDSPVHNPFLTDHDDLGMLPPQYERNN